MTASARHTLAILATATLALAIAYLTLTDPDPDPKPSLLSDKTYHVIAFAALVLPGALFHRRSLIWLVPAALVFGAAIEFIQPFVGRTAELADFLADVVGVALGLIAGQLMRGWADRSSVFQRTRP